jgi:tripartite-type tricarboxylate transporter receptor subunit TctC
VKKSDVVISYRGPFFGDRIAEALHKLRLVSIIRTKSSTGEFERNHLLIGDIMKASFFMKGVAKRLLSPKAMIVTVLMGSSTYFPAFSQPYPSKPIRFIVNTAAGGAVDRSARIIAQHLTAYLGEPVIVENKPGAGGILGAAYVAKADPDGYTLGFFAGGYTLLESFYSKLPINPSVDLVPVALAVSLPYVLVVPPTAPYKTFTEFVAYAKANPGKINYGSGGTGTLNHVFAAWLNSEAGLNMVHVPYKGAGPAMQALLSAEISMYPDPISTSIGFVKSGRVRALAVSGEKRSPSLPDVPTIKEAGIPVASVSWFGLLAPANVPAHTIQFLNKAINTVLEDPEVRQVFSDSGYDIHGGTPQEFGKLIKKETAQWAKVITVNNIKID